MVDFGIKKTPELSKKYPSATFWYPEFSVWWGIFEEIEIISNSQIGLKINIKMHGELLFFTIFKIAKFQPEITQRMVACSK